MKVHSNKLHRLFQFGLLGLSLACATVLGSKPAQAAGTILNTTVEFNMGNIYQNNGNNINGPDSKFSQVCRYNGSTYVVWVDGGRRPWVTKVTNGVPVSAPLDNGTDFTVEPDGHCGFSIGIDKNGYLHITGGMHNYDEWQTSAGTVPYPARYQGQRILYWKSAQPQSVSSGFTFAGGLNATTAIPGRRWIVGRFITDTNGELYYYSQCEAYHRSPSDGGPMPQGQFGIGLYRYNANTQTWTALGGKPDYVLPTGATYWTVLYWENSGYIPPYNWFQIYACTFQFDSSNRLHFAASVNTNTNIQGNNRLVYACSTDGGNTWKKANGTSIPALPLRGATGHANQADVVSDNQTNINGSYSGWATVTADAQGRPAVHVNGDNGASAGWFCYLNGSWSNTNSALNPSAGPADIGSLGLDGNLYLTQVGGPRTRRTPSLTQPALAYDYLGYNKLESVDERALRTEGTVYGIGVKNVNTPNVSSALLKTTITAAPLPSGWASADIGTATYTGNGGNSGYLNGKFVLTDYGSVIDNNSDCIHYTYVPFSGDATIIARVTSQSSASSLARAGVMMRESLASNAANALVALTPSSGAMFSWRSVAGGGTNHPSYGGVAAPYWVKLVRAGNNFSGYISPDAVTWTQVSSTQTIAMPSTIYVGLVGASYQNGYAMQSASFENVVVSATSPTLPNGTYKLVNTAGKVMDVANQSTSNGALVQQSSYTGGGSQLWTVTSLGNGEYKIIGVPSGRSLDVGGASSADGAVLQIANYAGGANQRWTITTVNPGIFKIVSVNSGKAISVSGGSIANGAQIVQWTYNQTGDQLWRFQAP